jgi:GNAT superfamily N-acetyltransferase
VTIVLRRSRPDDFDAWYALRSAIASEGIWIGAEPPVGRDEDSFVARVGADDALDVMAEVDGELVGTIGAGHGGGIVSFWMCVADGHRGLGIGRGLLDACLEWAAEVGAPQGHARGVAPQRPGDLAVQISGLRDRRPEGAPLPPAQRRVVGRAHDGEGPRCDCTGQPDAGRRGLIAFAGVDRRAESIRNALRAARDEHSRRGCSEGANGEGRTGGSDQHGRRSTTAGSPSRELRPRGRTPGSPSVVHRTFVDLATSTRHRRGAQRQKDSGARAPSVYPLASVGAWRRKSVILSMFAARVSGSVTPRPSSGDSTRMPSLPSWRLWCTS